MLAIVLVINAGMALLCILVAWQVWQLRRVLGQVADSLISAEQSTHDVLYGAPEAIALGETGVRSLRAQLRQLEPQLQRLQQVLGLLSLGQTAWRRRSRRTPSTRRFR
jgi:hypothetical protein